MKTIFRVLSALMLCPMLLMAQLGVNPSLDQMIESMLSGAFKNSVPASQQPLDATHQSYTHTYSANSETASVTFPAAQQQVSTETYDNFHMAVYVGGSTSTSGEELKMPPTYAFLAMAVTPEEYEQVRKELNEMSAEKADAAALNVSRISDKDGVVDATMSIDYPLLDCCHLNTSFSMHFRSVLTPKMFYLVGVAGGTSQLNSPEIQTQTQAFMSSLQRQ